MDELYGISKNNTYYSINIIYETYVTAVCNQQVVQCMQQEILTKNEIIYLVNNMAHPFHKIVRICKVLLNGIWKKEELVKWISCPEIIAVMCSREVEDAINDHIWTKKEILYFYPFFHLPSILFIASLKSSKHFTNIYCPPLAHISP